MRRTIGITLLGLTLAVHTVNAQRAEIGRKSMAGPRLGLTMLHRPGLPPVMTQFGWHFELDVRPTSTGPSLVLEEVLLAGGLEQDAFFPSATLLMGVRTPGGLEVGIGPNVTLLGTALAVGVGKSLNYGGVSLPLNLAMVDAPEGMRFTFLVGYAIPTSP